MKSGFLFAVSAVAVAWPVWAGENPLYRGPAEWVEVEQLAGDFRGPPVVLLDQQVRLENGTVTTYADQAVRIDNPQMLSALGTIQAPWLPDKGDLIVHRVEILREGKAIDLLDDGATFDVLRREQQLEQRTLTGAMTATMAVPGLRVGDILRFSFSTTISDQALNQEMQSVSPLLAKPFEAQKSRITYSWPTASAIRWATTRDLELPQPVEKAGYKSVTVLLPLPEAKEVPEDAPQRFNLPPFLQASSFDDWNEVSRVMAPLYSTANAIEPGGPVAEQVARIANAYSGEAERAVAVLRLVQDEIAYFANGMEGGNYIPQSPAETWSKRYGDCKAKTLLLLSMLHGMGIEAEAAAVSAMAGDAVSEMLPMPAAFDHVIVRAIIDGQERWLDGTSSGGSMAALESVPPFFNALPIRAEGADLVSLSPRPAPGFENDLRIVFDHRAGLDLPALYTVEWTFSGPFAGHLRAMSDQMNEDQKDDLIRSYLYSAVAESQLLDGDLEFDQETSQARIVAKALMTSPWRWQRGEGERAFRTPTSQFEFRPDRSRRDWRDIPVKIAGPESLRQEIVLLLPETGAPFSLNGKAQIDETVAGVRLQRSATLENGKLVIVDSTVSPGSEIDAESALAERARAGRIGSLALSLKAPNGVTRRHSLAGEKDRSTLKPFEEAYAALIAEDPEDAGNYFNRLQFRLGTYDRAGALQDADALVELDRSASHLWQRAGVHVEMGHLDRALEDARAASDLEPSPAAAVYEADLLAQLGRPQEAIDLLEGLDVAGDEQINVDSQLSGYYAQVGDKARGFELLAGLIEQRPGHPMLLNNICWYKAVWNYQPDSLAADCTKAVEQANWSPPVLDSRAFGYFRLGRYEEALNDLDAALAASPEADASLYMRGVVKRAMGRTKEGQRDIGHALARRPSLAASYARYGIKPD